MPSRLFTRSVICFLLSVLILVPLAGCGEETPVDPGDDNGGGGGNGPDTTPPSAITDLHLRSATQSTVALVWMAPGDDGQTGQAAVYDVRHSRATITEGNWQDATPIAGAPLPGPGGQIETFVVKGLASGSDHYFAIKTADEADNESALSNCATGTTISESTPPDAVQDMKGYAISDTEFYLTWTAPGDDGDTGTATAYDIRYSIRPINATNFKNATQLTDEPAPLPAGETQTYNVTGMTPGFNFYFSLKTVDDEDNWSGISNRCMGLGYTDYLMVTPNMIPPHLRDDDVLFMFRSDTDEELAEIIIYEMVWKNGQFVHDPVCHLISGHYPYGVHELYWDWTLDNGSTYTMWAHSELTIRLFLDGVLAGEASMRGSP